MSRDIRRGFGNIASIRTSAIKPAAAAGPHSGRLRPATPRHYRPWQMGRKPLITPGDGAADSSTPMVRFGVVLGLFALVAACSGGTPPQAGSPSPTASATVGPTETTIPTTTGSPSTGPALESARALVGSYRGDWRNETLGS